MGKRSGLFPRWWRWVLAPTVLVLVLLAFELGARLVFLPPRYVSNMPYDPDLGFRAPANVRVENADAKGGFPYHLNRLGFRGPELPATRAPSGTERLLFCGDAFLQGWQVRLEELAPYSTERVLRDLGHSVESFSVAGDGYGTAQQCILLRRYAGRLHPDCVVLCFDLGNDVADNSLDLVGRTNVSSGGYLRPFLVRGDSGAVHTTWLQPARSALRASSRAFQLIEHRLLRLGRIDSHAQLAGVRLDVDERIAAGELPHPYLEMFTATPSEPWEAGWSATAVALEAVRDEVGRLGAEFLVAIIPHRSQVQRDAVSFGIEKRMRSSSLDPGRNLFDWNRPERRLQELLRKLEIEAVSLLGPLRRETEASGLSMYREEGHWNGRGHQLAGREIARAIHAKAEGRQRTTRVPEGGPVDLAALVLAEGTEFDLRDELHPELIGSGWHSWRPDWWGETHGWVMRQSGELLIPNRAGELVVRGWLPRFAEFPATLRVDGREHVLEKAGAFLLRQDVEASGDGPYRMLVITALRPFAFVRGQQAGMVLQGFSLPLKD